MTPHSPGPAPSPGGGLPWVAEVSPSTELGLPSSPLQPAPLPGPPAPSPRITRIDELLSRQPGGSSHTPSGPGFRLCGFWCWHRPILQRPTGPRGSRRRTAGQRQGGRLNWRAAPVTRADPQPGAKLHPGAVNTGVNSAVGSLALEPFPSSLLKARPQSGPLHASRRPQPWGTGLRRTCRRPRL